MVCSLICACPVFAALLFVLVCSLLFSLEQSVRMEKRKQARSYSYTPRSFSYRPMWPMCFWLFLEDRNHCSFWAYQLLKKKKMKNPKRKSSQPKRKSTEIMPCQKDMSERMSEDMSEIMSKDMSERMSEDMSERMSKDMPERMSERMSKDMSERMSKDMSERMSEDICPKECQKICQKECQKICQKECQKIASSQSAKLRVTERISGDELYVYPHLTRSGWHKI